MDKLALAIGPAPSERPFNELIELCLQEIKRCNSLLSAPIITKGRKKPPAKKKKKKLELSDIEELRALLKETLEKEGN